MKKIIYSVFMMFMVAMTFTSCADVPMPYDDPNQAAIDEEGSAVEPAGLGTIDDPYNVAAANALIESGEAPSTNVYVKGKIVSIKEIDTGSFGNATFYISDDGTSKNQLTVYRSKSLGNKPFKSEDEIKDGDEVIICGVIVNYNGTYEFTQGCYIYSLNGETGGSGAVGTPTGSGTQADPYNVAAIIGVASALASNAKSDVLYFKGKVVSIATDKNGVVQNYDSGYGNATFYISDDGTENGQFYVYRALYFDNKDYTSGDILKVGDEVIICGKVTNYNGKTPESAQKEAYLYSLNGKTSSSGSSSGGGGGSTTSSVTKETNGGTLTFTDTGLTASSNKITVDLNEQGFTDKQEVKSLTLSDGTTITFSAEDSETSPTFYTSGGAVRLYARNSVTIQGASKGIGKVVLTCHSYSGTDYVGNADSSATSSDKSMKITNTWGKVSGGTQMRIQKMEITYAQ
jgi:hypothetical protein